MLEGKIALVTGVSRGIGHRIALTLGQEGASIIINYNDSVVKVEEVVKETEAAGGKAEAIQYNVSDSESYGKMMADVVSRHGRLDILVSNAGIIRDSLLMKVSEEDFDAVINTNLEGIFNCIKHISRQMLKQKAGRIISISSASGILDNAGRVNYCTAKAGVIGITKSTARKLASGGITVNTVALGFIATGMTDILSDGARAAATKQIPVRHLGSTQDVAETVAFLTSDKTGYITGQVLSVNGGTAM